MLPHGASAASAHGKLTLPEKIPAGKYGIFNGEIDAGTPNHPCHSEEGRSPDTGNSRYDDCFYDLEVALYREIATSLRGAPFLAMTSKIQLLQNNPRMQCIRGLLLSFIR
jgi:hypothetical protein